MKNKDIFEMAEFIIGLCLTGSALAYLITGGGVFLLVLFVSAYVAAPLLFMVVDLVQGRIRKGLMSVVLAPLFYLFSSWHGIVFILLMMPGIAISMIMGPVSIVLAFVSGACLLIGGLQFIAGSRFGLSDLASAEYFMICGPVFLICGVMLHLIFVRGINPGEKLTFWLDDIFKDCLKLMEDKIYEKRRSSLLGKDYEQGG